MEQRDLLIASVGEASPGSGIIQVKMEDVKVHRVKLISWRKQSTDASLK